MLKLRNRIRQLTRPIERGLSIDVGDWDRGDRNITVRKPYAYLAPKASMQNS
jgi:hypothetical protein